MRTERIGLLITALTAILTLGACSGDADGDGSDDGNGTEDTGTPMDTVDDPGEDTAGADMTEADTAGQEDTSGTEDATGGDDAAEAKFETVDCSEVDAVVTVDLLASNEFDPASVEIIPGDVVEWNWQGGTHSVTEGGNCTPAGGFDSGVTSASSADPFCVRFNQAGEVPYHCTPHCGVGMTGTVTVGQ